MHLKKNIVIIYIQYTHLLLRTKNILIHRDDWFDILLYTQNDSYGTYTYKQISARNDHKKQKKTT